MHPTCSDPDSRAPRAHSTAPRRLVGHAARAVLAVLGALFLGLLLGASPAAAANSLSSSTPADGSTATTSPASIEMKFNEALGQQNKVAVVCDGDPFTVGTPQVGADLLTLTVPLTSSLPKGSCVVGWTVSNQDGTPNPKAVAAYFAKHPQRIPRMARLAKGAKLATQTAADAAIRAATST
jgi:methionine-rich copper-binding protein CopC